MGQFLRQSLLLRPLANGGIDEDEGLRSCLKSIWMSDGDRQYDDWILHEAPVGKLARGPDSYLQAMIKIDRF